MTPSSLRPLETSIKVDAPPPPSSPPRPPPPQGGADLRPFRRWFPWLTPAIVAANIALFIVTMYVNDCPDNSESCIVRGFGRFSFQPMKQNPLLGPSATTYTVGIIMLFRGFSPKDHCSWCHYLSCIPTSLWNCNKSTNNSYCLITETGNQYNLTCEGNGRSKMYLLPKASNDQIQAMCTQLCT